MLEPAANRTPPRDYTSALRRLLGMMFTLALLAAAGWWSWHQAFMARPRALWELSRMPAPTTLGMPVEGVDAMLVADTFGAPRGSDRSHAGVDIFASRGTAVLSATHGVVVSIRDSGLGGKQVWVLGPARERHYYAHLDGWAAGLALGDVVWPGDRLGVVGNSGNARGTPPHLHYGVYGTQGAYDPLPLLRAGVDRHPEVAAVFSMRTGTRRSACARGSIRRCLTLGKHGDEWFQSACRQTVLDLRLADVVGHAAARLPDSRPAARS